jgi:predicted RNase H-like HicB family nuclease
MKFKDKLTLYQIVVEPCEEGGYFASCPPLQGCHAEGESFGEAVDNLRDVIKAHFEIRQAKGNHKSS